MPNPPPVSSSGVPSPPSESGPDQGVDLRHPVTPALLFSLVLHLFLLLAIGLLHARAPRGSEGATDRPVGIALVHRMPDRDRYEDTVDPVPTSESEVSEASETGSSDAAGAAVPAEISSPVDLAGLLKAMESTPSPRSAAGLTGDTSLSGDAFGSQGGKKPSTSGEESTAMMFGVSGSGSEFVYVMDRSDSMNGFGGRPLRAAKAELIRSLRSLTDRQRFQIVFYNDKPAPFRPSGMGFQMVPGDSSIVTVAEQYVRSITAFGGTEHRSALHLALRMSPDVIFFLTDASIPRLSANELAVVRRRATQSGTTIHAIEFGTDALAPPGSFLRDLAKQNGGSYQYVNVQSLGPRRPAAEATKDGIAE